jgi:hypothetical protein
MMYHFLANGKLTSGETVNFGYIEAPDLEWSDRLLSFLAHKAPDWRFHLERALAGALDGLRTRFYIATMHDELISQVMISDARGCGILSHVFTAPQWRRRNAYRQLMTIQMEHCVASGIKILTLSTGFNSHPYWIYHSFGFRSIAPGAGTMMWKASPDSDRELLQPSSHVTTRALQWDDWPVLNVSACQPVGPSEPLPRFSTMGVNGEGNLEGPFISFLRRTQGFDPAFQRVLVTERGAVVGWCFLSPDPSWFNRVWRADVCVLPGFTEFCAQLTDSIRWPELPVWTVTTPDQVKSQWLHNLGFSRRTMLKDWLDRNGHPADAEVWERPFISMSMFPN